MHIDCGSCSVRGAACAECMVSVLLGVPEPAEHARPAPALALLVNEAQWEGEQADGTPLPAGMDPAQQRALAVLAAAGVVPGLRRVSRLRRAG